MYAILVLQLGLSPEWVLDKAEMYEVSCLIDNMWMKDKSAWERTRMEVYSTYQSQSTKKIDFSNFMEFDWEKEKPEEVEDENPISVDEMKSLILKEEEKLNKTCH